MTAAVANPPDRHAPAAQRRNRYDLVWVVGVGAVDSILRRWYGVRTFTDDPACLLRIARVQVDRRIVLSDGSVVNPGESVAVLHFWNERMPPFSPAGPDFAWAISFRDRMVASLRRVSRHLLEDHGWDDVHAVHACVSFGGRCRRWQIRRVAARFGFELVPGEAPPGLHEWGEDMLIWAFTRAFNPAALRRRALRRDRTELWISRATLSSRYG
jgi:hypothetical protein